MRVSFRGNPDVLRAAANSAKKGDGAALRRKRGQSNGTTVTTGSALRTIHYIFGQFHSYRPCWTA